MDVLQEGLCPTLGEMTPATEEGEFTPLTKSHWLALQKVLPVSPGGLQKQVDVGFWLVLVGMSRAGAGTCFCRILSQERCLLFPLSSFWF